MSEKKVKLIFSAVAIFSAMLIVFLLCFVIVQFFKLKNLKSTQAEKQAMLESMLQQGEDYDEAIKYIQDDRFIEEYARYYLNYGKDGEQRYDA